MQKEAIEATKKSSGNEFIDGKVAGICTPGYLSAHLNDIPAENSRLVPYEPNANDAGKLQMVLATKETEISDVALRVLLQKREEMVSISFSHLLLRLLCYFPSLV